MNNETYYKTVPCTEVGKTKGHRLPTENKFVWAIDKHNHICNYSFGDSLSQEHWKESESNIIAWLEPYTPEPVNEKMREALVFAMRMLRYGNYLGNRELNKIYIKAESAISSLPEPALVELTAEEVRKERPIDREKIKDLIEAIQDKVDKMGFKGQNEYDLHLREELTDLIVYGLPNFALEDKKGKEPIGEMDEIKRLIIKLKNKIESLKLKDKILYHELQIIIGSISHNIINFSPPTPNAPYIERDKIVGILNDELSGYGDLIVDDIDRGKLADAILALLPVKEPLGFNEYNAQYLAGKGTKENYADYLIGFNSAFKNKE